MPMFGIWFRFPDEALSRSEFMRELEIEVGRSGAKQIEDLQVDGRFLSFGSMNFIMLIYGAKVCLAHGAVGVDSTGVNERPLRLPAWTAQRWTEIGWLRRLRIWIGPVTLSTKAA